ncbi:MAG: LrgA family protein [Gemmatimonadetes bacterium]|nr:LrgA family protein [Gemmatimonadota bacterium]
MLVCVKGAAAIGACLALGEAAARWLRLPLPGNLVGMLLMTAALRLRLLRMETVRPLGDWLLRNMALFFVPAGVGLMRYFGLLRAEWLPIVGGCVAGLLAVLLVVGPLQQRLEAGGAADG